MNAKIAFIKASDEEWPACPYCKKELREVKTKTRGFLKSVDVFWCPHCRSLLSISTTFNG